MQSTRLDRARRTASPHFVLPLALAFAAAGCGPRSATPEAGARAGAEADSTSDSGAVAWDGGVAPVAIDLPRGLPEARPNPDGDPSPEPSAPRNVPSGALALGDGPLPPAPPGTRWIEDTFPDGSRKSARTVLSVEDGIVNHGPYRRWHPTGLLAEECSFEHGERHGVHVQYFDTGLRKAYTEFDHGREHGVLRRWNAVNELVQESHFENGARNGVERLWWDGEHRRAETHWKDDLPHGAWTQWHFDGPASETGSYERGAKVGEWTYRTPKGELQLVENYSAGRLHGRVVVYDEQGALVREGEYRDGLAEGEQREFHPGGTVLKARIQYAGGRPNGAAIAWHPNGAKESEGEMRDGLREGRWTYWNSDGTVHSTLTGTYRAGERVSD